MINDFAGDDVHGEYLNCFTYREENIRIINGTLVLTAIREKYLNKYYTSSVITTKQSFTYGKFEMRAALPKGKMLSSHKYYLTERNDKFHPEMARVWKN